MGILRIGMPKMNYNEADRERWHKLLDYALDNGEKFVIMQQMYIYKEKIYRETYKMHIDKTEE